MDVAERFCTRLYASDVRPRETAECISLACDVQLATKVELGKATKGMKMGKAAGDDGITEDIFKKGGDIVLQKLLYHFRNA